MKKLSSVRCLFVALLAAAPAVCLAQYKSTTGKIVEEHGKKFFVVPLPVRDTITVIDPVAGQSIWQIRKGTLFPTLVSGQKIYNNSEITTPVACNERVIENTLEEHILRKIRSELIRLPNGIYSIKTSDLVVDRSGRIIYHQFAGMIAFKRMQYPVDHPFFMHDSGYYYDSRPLGADTVAMIADGIAAVFANARVFAPARIGNRKVIALYSTFFEQFLIVVKDGKMSLDKRNVLVSKGIGFSAYKGRKSCHR